MISGGDVVIDVTIIPSVRAELAFNQTYVLYLICFIYGELWLIRLAL